MDEETDGREEPGAWVPRYRVTDEMEFYLDLAFHETERWIQAVTRKKFAYSDDMRKSLENGILLCDLLNCLKAGSVKRVNKLHTPIAGFVTSREDVQRFSSAVFHLCIRLCDNHNLGDIFQDNLSVFLNACHVTFNLDPVHLFNPNDLEDWSHKAIAESDPEYVLNEIDRRLCNVATTVYWLGHSAQQFYDGPQLDLTAFVGILGTNSRDLSVLSKDYSWSSTESQSRKQGLCGKNSANNSFTSSNRDSTCDYSIGSDEFGEVENMYRQSGSLSSLNRSGMSDRDRNRYSATYDKVYADRHDSQWSSSGQDNSHSGQNGHMHTRSLSGDSLDYSSQSGGSHSRHSSGSIDAGYTTRRTSKGTTKSSPADKLDGPKPLQFIKMSPNDLTRQAEEQMRTTEERKMVSSHLIQDDSIDWQSNLSSWKTRRKSRSSCSHLEDLDNEDQDDKTTHDDQLTQDEPEHHVPRGTRTFNEIVTDKERRKSKFNIPTMDDEETDDIDTILSSRGNSNSYQNDNSELDKDMNDNVEKHRQSRDHDNSLNIHSSRHKSPGWKSSDHKSRLDADVDNSARITNNLSHQRSSNANKQNHDHKDAQSKTSELLSRFERENSNERDYKKSNKDKDTGGNYSPKISNIRQSFEQQTVKETTKPVSKSYDKNSSRHDRLPSDGGKASRKVNINRAEYEEYKSNRDEQFDKASKQLEKDFLTKTIKITTEPNNFRGFGFKFSGGADHGLPITVQNVIRGGAADVCELMANDEIMLIGHRDATILNQFDAQHAIGQCLRRGHLELCVKRYIQGPGYSEDRDSEHKDLKPTSPFTDHAEIFTLHDAEQITHEPERYKTPMMNRLIQEQQQKDDIQDRYDDDNKQQRNLFNRNVFDRSQKKAEKSYFGDTSKSDQSFEEIPTVIPPAYVPPAYVQPAYEPPVYVPTQMSVQSQVIYPEPDDNKPREDINMQNKDQREPIQINVPEPSATSLGVISPVYSQDSGSRSYDDISIGSSLSPRDTDDTEGSTNRPPDILLRWQRRQPRSEYSYKSTLDSSGEQTPDDNRLSGSDYNFTVNVDTPDNSGKVIVTPSAPKPSVHQSVTPPEPVASRQKHVQATEIKPPWEMESSQTDDRSKLDRQMDNGHQKTMLQMQLGQGDAQAGIIRLEPGTKHHASDPSTKHDGNGSSYPEYNFRVNLAGGDLNTNTDQAPWLPPEPKPPSRTDNIEEKTHELDEKEKRIHERKQRIREQEEKLLHEEEKLKREQEQNQREREELAWQRAKEQERLDAHGVTSKPWQPVTRTQKEKSATLPVHSSKSTDPQYSSTVVIANKDRYIIKDIQPSTGFGVSMRPSEGWPSRTHDKDSSHGSRTETLTREDLLAMSRSARPLESKPVRSGCESIETESPDRRSQERKSSATIENFTNPIVREMPTRKEKFSLNAAPRQKFRESADWMNEDEKKKQTDENNPPRRRSQFMKQEYSNPNEHWLIQEAERRRLAEHADKGQSSRSQTLPTYRSGPIKPSDSLSQWRDNVSQRNFRSNALDPSYGSHRTNVNNMYNPNNENNNANTVSPSAGYPRSSQLSETHGGSSSSLNSSGYYAGVTSPGQPDGSQWADGVDPSISVSGKQKCSHCAEELGFGAAMVIESLNLRYHIQCFRCCVCHTELGNGASGADVRVRGWKLHCHNCYSNDEGLKFSKV